ncbi:F0F1 ATP synthase assembly protein I [Marinomonas sp. M1K-6]|uniref:F0F1 ATP synthase assembly protein I n=1 Tax=Marinomonas profundi TaxID=2726122 RepID=A0A847RAA3_9GAMM|nr:ATP synthase subunit I [Marinomonas profundi]NLQ17160.1 F0F1 ATP synthase assembly protein I [Marinomonas profundi]UDV04647.1 ATP synthase subunit I [Marinomonas profundi]
MEVNKPLSASAIISAKKKTVFRFLRLQIFLTIFVSLGIFYVSGGLSGYSFLLGAFCSILPNIYMAWRVFGHKGILPAKEVVKSFYRGEAGKLVLTVLLLSLVFILVKPLAAGSFFIGFSLAILSHWLSPAIIR